jgi:2-polyprenyl-3-methyl-5-hydroxy-6-metoxy-1,4-benzoquinol methylase
MDKNKKKIRIIKSDSNKEDYTFVTSDNILNHIKNIKSIINTIESGTKPNNRIEKKIHLKKVDNKGRKILGKSM